jgi:hypothetical protein
MKLYVHQTMMMSFDAPDDATHFQGSLDEFHFYKLTQVGVVGDHWWEWKNGGWKFSGHIRPILLGEITESMKQKDSIEARAFGHLFDLLSGDDGEAWSQGESFLKHYRPDLYNKIGMRDVPDSGS